MWSTFRLRIQHPAQPVSELPVRLNSKDRVGPKLDRQLRGLPQQVRPMNHAATARRHLMMLDGVGPSKP